LPDADVSWNLERELALSAMKRHSMACNVSQQADIQGFKATTLKSF
jgi:hypothetical protein